MGRRVDASKTETMALNPARFLSLSPVSPLFFSTLDLVSAQPHAPDFSNEFRGTISIRTGFQSLFGYIKHVIQLLGRHSGSGPELAYLPPYEGYSATYAYVRESNMQRGSEGEERKARGRERRRARPHSL